jgi:hypothetical protein
MMPSHNVIITNSTIGGPGTPVFSQPTQNTTIAFGWHRATYNTKVIGCYIQGRITVQGFGMELLNCTMEAGNAQSVGLFEVSNGGPPLDIRIVGNKIYVYQDHFDDGILFHSKSGDWNVAAGAIASLVIADNDVYVMFNSTDELIHISDTNTKSSATGVIHIVGNRVGHEQGGSIQPLCNIDITDGLEIVVANNSLPANMTLVS